MKAVFPRRYLGALVVAALSSGLPVAAWAAGKGDSDNAALILKTAVGAYEFGQIQGRIRAS